jgi:hypothetical protein
MDKWIIWAVAACLFMAGVLSLFASQDPDGLERVAEDLGFIGSEAHLHSAPAPDYSIPGMENEMLAASIAGITGTMLMFAFGFVAAGYLRH